MSAWMRLWRAIGSLGLFVAAGPAAALPCAGFTDVEDTSPFCSSVEWIRNRGITLGCTTTAYCPDAYVTRLQMAAFIARLQPYTAFYFSDANGRYIGRALNPGAGVYVEVEVGGERVFLRVHTDFITDGGRLFASVDCTGQAYGGTSSHEFGRRKAITATPSEVYLVSDTFDSGVSIHSIRFSPTTCVSGYNSPPGNYYRVSGPYSAPNFQPPFTLN